MPPRLRHRGEAGFGRGRGQRLASLSVLSLLVACSRTKPLPLPDLQREGIHHLQTGDLAGADAEASEGLRRAARDAVWAWRFRVLRAEVLAARGRTGDAVALLDEARPAGEPEAADVRAAVTRSRARCLTPDAPDRFQRAEADLDAARRLADGLGAPDLVVEVALCRGTCAALGGDLGGAEARFLEALAVARRERQPILEAKAAGALGWLRTRAGLLDDGAEWLKRALALSEAAGAHGNTVKVLSNLGWSYNSLGEYERALGFLARGLALAEERGFGEEQLRILLTIGSAHGQLGNLDAAAAAYRRALALARALGSRPEVATLLGNLALVAIWQGKLDDAERDNEEALRIKRELGDPTSTPYSLFRSAQIWMARGEHGKAEPILRDVIASASTDAALRWEARAVLASLLVETGRPADAEAEFRAALALTEDALARLRSSEPQISFFATLRNFHDSYVAFLVDQGRPGDALAVADGARARVLRELGGQRALPPIERVQQAAAAHGAVLLFYVTAPRRSFLWVVTPRKTELHTLPGEAELRARVETHQARILRGRDPLEEGTADATWLFETLVRPAGPDLTPGATVIVVPDGPLHRINFETLVVPGSRPHYWIEDVTLATAPSLALLATVRDARAPSPAPRLLVIGDPTPADPELSALPGAGGEVRRVADQFEPSQRLVLTGAAAEPSAYRRSDPASFSFLHFAAHAQANADVPLDSAVILSARGDAYKLYARDIATIPLSAELVTLSACRSAGSRAYAGEGLVGLAWAFLGSGAHNVIAGLWDVADASSPELMERLYRELRGGRSPAEALRVAKLALLRSGTALRKPFYWAPFVLFTSGS